MYCRPQKTGQWPVEEGVTHCIFVRLTILSITFGLKKNMITACSSSVSYYKIDIVRIFVNSSKTAAPFGTFTVGAVARQLAAAQRVAVSISARSNSV